MKKRKKGTAIKEKQEAVFSLLHFLAAFGIDGDHCTTLFKL